MTRQLARLAALAMLLLAFDAGAAEAVTKTFCVSGTSTGAGWSYGLGGPGLPALQVTTDGVPEGGSAEDLARKWVDSINRAQGDPPAFRARFVRTAGGRAYFSITSPRDFEFEVDGCTITGNPAGCSFNPTVEEREPPLPVLTIVVIVLVLGGVIVVIIVIVRRRRSP